MGYHGIPWDQEKIWENVEIPGGKHPEFDENMK